LELALLQTTKVVGFIIIFDGKDFAGNQHCLYKSKQRFDDITLCNHCM